MNSRNEPGQPWRRRIGIASLRSENKATKWRLKVSPVLVTETLKCGKELILASHSRLGCILVTSKEGRGKGKGGKGEIDEGEEEGERRTKRSGLASSLLLLLAICGLCRIAHRPGDFRMLGRRSWKVLGVGSFLRVESLGSRHGRVRVC